MKVLVLSKDPTLFVEPNATQTGDSRRRHLHYAERLRQRFPGSELRILTYTKHINGNVADAPAPGLRLYGTASRHRALYLLGLLWLVMNALRDGWRPDVVTVQTPWEEGGLGWILSRLLGARFVPQLHFDLFSPEWLVENPLNPWKKRVGTFVLGKADIARVVSEPLGEKLITTCNLSRQRVQVAPVGVNFIAMQGERQIFQSALGLQGPVVLFVGRLCSQKNLTLWLQIAQDVLEQCPRTNFILVGDGEEKSALESMVKSEGLADRVRFIGPRKHSELPPIYAAADVFLLTSNYEGLPRVVVEAQLAGVPVVSTACTGPEDLIDDGVTGFLLAKGDRAGLTNAVVRLLRETAFARRMGKTAREQAEQSFSLPVLTDRMIDVWAAACAS